MQKRISHYEVVDKLGEGGMGEVYRARDTKLNREVALKVIPASFARDAQRMGRFEREAQVLAALNHPNIGQIYGLEDASGEKTLVLELIEGPTLDERLASGPLELNEALKIALQIAEALEFAHEKGIVHRDLKPSNIKLTPDLKVKVLDFGLAKALETHAQGSPDLSQSPTLTAAATQAGTILGTAGYMSPEQAAGQEVDRRSDIWAFGVVLWEMLTGRRLFQGDTVSHTLAAVLRDEPNWDSIPKEVPEAVRKMIGRCLERDVDRRLQAIGEARILLTDALAGNLKEEQLEAPRGSFLSTARVAVLSAGLLITLLIGAGVMHLLSPEPPTVPLRKYEVEIAGLLATGRDHPVISPDGTRIAFRAEDKLWVRDLGQLEARELSDTEGGSYFFWGPDSRALGFVKNNRLWKTVSGETSLICELPSEMGSGGWAAWDPQGNISFVTGNSGLYRVSEIGGDPVLVMEPQAEVEQDFHYPTLLPDNRGILVVLHRKEAYDTLLVIDETERHQVLQLEGSQLASAFYSPTGHIVFERQGASDGIWAVPFSLNDFATTGDPFLVMAGGRYPSVSRDGTLLAFRGTTGTEGQVAISDRNGTVEDVGRPLIQPTQPKFSPDGTRVAVTGGGVEGHANDVWVHDLQRGTSTRLQQPDQNEFWVHWAPDGDDLYYSSFARAEIIGIYRRRADGSDMPELISDKGLLLEVSPNGQILIIGTTGSSADAESFYLDLGGDGELVRLDLKGRILPALSPDGRFLAYSIGDVGQMQVYLTRFPSLEGRWQVSVESGFMPKWSSDGRSIYFVGPEQMLQRVTFEEANRISLGKPEPVLNGEAEGLTFRSGYDIAGDGDRILAQRAADTSERGLTLIQNWYAEFKR